MFDQNYFEKILKIKKSEKNIIKIAEFINKNFKNFSHSFEYKYYPFESLNLFKIINVYGYGNCKCFSILFKFLMDSIGVKCLVIYGEFGFTKDNKKQNHVFNIIELRNKKYLIDTDFGIIKYKGKLIKYESFINKKIFFHFYDKRKSNYKFFKSNMINLYNEKNTQQMNIENYRFPYKKKLSEYFSSLYFVQLPIFTRKFKEEKKFSTNKLIYKNRVVKYNQKMIYLCSTTLKVDDYNFNLNNFPYLIRDIKVISYKKGNFELYQNNKKKLYKLNVNIFKNLKYFQNPIYSFSLISKKRIKSIEITYQKSLLQKKIIKFINKISKIKN